MTILIIINVRIDKKIFCETACILREYLYFRWNIHFHTDVLLGKDSVTYKWQEMLLPNEEIQYANYPST